MAFLIRAGVRGVKDGLQAHKDYNDPKFEERIRSLSTSALSNDTRKKGGRTRGVVYGLVMKAEAEFGKRKDDGVRAIGRSCSVEQSQVEREGNTSEKVERDGNDHKKVEHGSQVDEQDEKDENPPPPYSQSTTYRVEDHPFGPSDTSRGTAYYGSTPLGSGNSTYTTERAVQTFTSSSGSREMRRRSGSVSSVSSVSSASSFSSDSSSSSCSTARGEKTRTKNDKRRDKHERKETKRQARRERKMDKREYRENRKRDKREYEQSKKALKVHKEMLKVEEKLGQRRLELEGRLARYRSPGPMNGYTR